MRNGSCRVTTASRGSGRSIPRGRQMGGNLTRLSFDLRR